MGRYDKDTFIKSILAMMRYAYLYEGKLPSGINTEEWEGTEDSPGLKHQMLSFANELRREAFFAGYLEGARDAFGDCMPVDKVFMVEANRDGAWRAWAKYDKD